MRGTRTTVLVAGAVERTPTRTTAVLLVAVTVEHDERQLSLGFEREAFVDVETVDARRAA